MRFSVIIPSYGQAEFLKEAITSALKQDFTDYEVIVVDDGSTDGSLEIAKSFGDSIKLVAQANKGLASARNAGIMNATGEYILPLDADDLFTPDALRLIDEKIKATNADVVSLSMYAFGLGTGVVSLMPDPKFDDFKIGNRLTYCSAIRRTALLETGGYSPKMDTLGGWEDLHLWYDLMRRGKKIVTIQEPLLMYRTKETSMWTAAEKNKKALWEQIIKDFPETKEHAKD